MYLQSYIRYAILDNKEGDSMAILYNKLNAIMQEKGVKKFDLRKAGVNAQILDKALSNGNIDSRTINKLCKLLDCQPGDFMEYVPDQSADSTAQQ